MEFEIQVELVREYVEDSLEFINDLDGMFLRLEQNVGHTPEPEIVSEILSSLHTFKGNSGMMGFSSLQKYTHNLEDIFKNLQSGALQLDDELAEFLMGCANVLRNAVSNISTENPTDSDLAEQISSLEQFIVNKSRSLKDGDAHAVSPLREAANSVITKTNVLKVDFKRLDHLLNLVGELVIYRTRLGRIESQFKEMYGEKGIGIDLSATSEQIGKVTTELHEAIMQVRMLPIKQVFMRFPRAVRDLAREKSKEINIQFFGEDTELDKTVIDEIGEPLLHLLRNAVDHGIEKPEERMAAGKPRQGSVIVRASQESSHIIITVEDDGRGIDEAALRRKAEQAGLILKDEPGQNDLNLIFHAGLSTADVVTEVSGRGLGMDVVKKSLAKINGSIDVESTHGIGTRFTIKLPLTLAIISVLMVKVAGEQYAIPLGSVVKSINVKREEIHSVNNREVTNIRDKILPLVKLTEIFNLPQSANGKKLYTVVVQSSYRQMGIVVDSLLGQQEVVIKALDDYVGKSLGIAGATILGDGKVVLIVDVPALMDWMKTSNQGLKRPEGVDVQ